MRGIDYLASRKDVDAQRIGAEGCSGGGTATAYLAALDDRVKAAGVACYITSFSELLPSPTGVQEAEQSIPGFIAQGLDFADYVEAFAPKPYAIISTTEDMFPFKGANQTYEEAQRIFRLHGAGEKLAWIVGPGGHGNLGPISRAIVGFFAHYLGGARGFDADFTPMRLEHPEDLLCTPTGQISTSFGGETVASMIAARAREVLPVESRLTDRRDVGALRSRVQSDIRTLAGVTAADGSSVRGARTLFTEQRDGYRLETVVLETEPGVELPALVVGPDRPGRKAAVLWMGPKDGEVDRLAKGGRVVVVFEPRPSPPGSEGSKSPYLGAFNLLSLRASLVGKTIIGLRIDDAIHAFGWLASRADVDPAGLMIYGKGPLGVVALHVAALDDRVLHVVLDGALSSYRSAIDQPLHRNISEVMIPGVVRKYDLPDLLLAIAPRDVTVISPRDATGAEIGAEQFRREMSYVFESDVKLGTPERIIVEPRRLDQLVPEAH
jgi:dienelactone hydrolase